jgi:hypothetical protein
LVSALKAHRRLVLAEGTLRIQTADVTWLRWLLIQIVEFIDLLLLLVLHRWMHHAIAAQNPATAGLLLRAGHVLGAAGNVLRACWPDFRHLVAAVLKLLLGAWLELV